MDISAWRMRNISKQFLKGGNNMAYLLGASLLIGMFIGFGIGAAIMGWLLLPNLDKFNYLESMDNWE